MTAVTKGVGKEITTVPGCEVAYLSSIQNGYTYASRFGAIRAAFFQNSGTGSEVAVLGISGGTVTFTTSGTIAGYLQLWGE